MTSHSDGCKNNLAIPARPSSTRPKAVPVRYRSSPSSIESSIASSSKHESINGRSSHGLAVSSAIKSETLTVPNSYEKSTLMVSMEEDDVVSTQARRERSETVLDRASSKRCHLSRGLNKARAVSVKVVSSSIRAGDIADIDIRTKRQRMDAELDRDVELMKIPYHLSGLARDCVT